MADNRQKKQYRLDKPEGCDINGCPRPHHSNGLCVAHWHRRQKYGDPLAGPPLRKPRSDIGKPRPQRGQGLTDEYHLNHKNVREARGPAWQHQCQHCGRQAADWATIKGTAGESPDDFMPLCKPCHARYDDFGSRPAFILARPSGETHHSAKLTEDEVREIRSRAAETGAAIAREFGVTESLISEIRLGKIWKEAGGPVARPRPRRASLQASPGERFGKLTVSSPVIARETTGRHRKTIQCICDCGTSTVVRLENLFSGNTTSCGCLQKQAGQKNRRLTVEAGQRFGRGVVLEPDLRVNGRRSAKLRCDCGREYVTVIYALLNGATVSCGCRSKETQLGHRGRGENHARARERAG